MRMDQLIESIEADFETNDLEEWGDATHYMKVKNPKTGNMNKIGFNDQGRAVSGDKDLIQSINSRRKDSVQGDRKAVGLIKKHNTRVDNEGGHYTAKAAGTKQIAAGIKNDRSAAADAQGDSRRDPKDAGKAAGAGVTSAAETALQRLMLKKQGLKKFHGAKSGEKSGIGKLARKLKTFFKPKTLSDREIVDPRK